MQKQEITFTHVLFLFQHKHVMIEKLLQFLVAKIDAQLFEAIEVKNFEACNVQHSDEANPEMKIIFEVIDFWCEIRNGSRWSKHVTLEA